METIIIIGIIIFIFISPGIIFNKETENLKDIENLKKIENRELNIVELNYYQLKELMKIRKMIRFILTTVIITFIIKIILPILGISSIIEIFNNF